MQRSLKWLDSCLAMLPAARQKAVEAWSCDEISDKNNSLQLEDKFASAAEPKSAVGAHHPLRRVATARAKEELRLAQDAARAEARGAASLAATAHALSGEPLPEAMSAMAASIMRPLGAVLGGGSELSRRISAEETAKRDVDGAWLAVSEHSYLLGSLVWYAGCR